MPDGCKKVPMSHILTYEEIERICRAAAELGIRKIKVTGGEPFVRLGCTDLMRNLKAVSGIDEVTVTTNGQVLERYIDELKEIGIDGINISLDTLDPDKYAFMTRGGKLQDALDGIETVLKTGCRKIAGTAASFRTEAVFREPLFCPSPAPDHNSQVY